MDATTLSGKARTATLPSGRRHTPAAGALAWFEAETSAGPLRLCATGAAQNAAAAAIALQQSEPLLDALDAWTGFALDWRWLVPPLGSAARAAHACADWDVSGDGDVRSCRLELPWALLRILPAPPAALVRRLRWHEVQVVLAVAHLRLGSDELALLEPGGAVVLPQSMRAAWHGLLRAAGEPALPGLGMPVVLAAPSMARRTQASAPARHDGATAADDGARRMCEVRLETPRTLHADRLAPWFEGDLGEIGPRATLWRCATEYEPAQPLATGRLMPWGDGWALVLETLSGDPNHATTARV